MLAMVEAFLRLKLINAAKQGLTYLLDLFRTVWESKFREMMEKVWENAN